MRRIDCDDANFTVVLKGTERYIYVYSDATRGELASVLARHASDPSLSLTTADATRTALAAGRILSSCHKESQTNRK